MSRLSNAIVAFLLVAASFHAYSQSPESTQELTFQVPPSQTWVDTGLDLHPGDALKFSISARAVVAAGTGVPACDPAGLNAPVENVKTLPLPSAPAGALIARLHGDSSVPILVASTQELKVDAAGHLLLGTNTPDNPVCQGALTVNVQRVAAESSSTAAANQTRGQQLKSQLANAAQVFMAGQFGVGKNDSSSTTAANSAVTSTGPSANSVSLTASNGPLDPDLRKSLDSMPRRVNDQLNNLGDMVNFVIIGSQKDVQDALEAATWHVADTDNRKAVVSAILQTYDKKDYLAMPMSTLYLFGRKQDFGYEMAEPIAMVASRHHFRIWKAPFQWNGNDVWVGAGTHDIGFAKDLRNNGVTHKIDPAVDGERDNIGMSLQKTNKAKTVTYYLPPDAVRDAKNATGDAYHSDGRLLVVFLQ